MKGIFITGTDTGVGKTFVTVGLGHMLRKQALRVGVMKPLESGCRMEEGELVPSDALDLAQVSSPIDDIRLVCPYRFQSPLAPKAAAEAERVVIDFSKIVRCYEKICERHDVTLVEGAGGLLVPLREQETNADLALLLGTPLLLVVANRLGAINHALLTLEVAKARGIRVLGYVLNRTGPDITPAVETNPAVLREMIGVPCLGEVPFLSEGENRAEVFKGRVKFELDGLAL